MTEINQRNLTEKKGAPDIKITLTQNQLTEFRKVLKSGIYKELYERDLITDSQLSRLLSRVSAI